MSAPDFWSDPARAKIVAQELDRVKTEVSGWEKFEQDLAELAGMAEMALKEQDKALEADLMAKFGDLRGLFEHLRLSTFLSQKYDKNNAFLSIHAGAGGVDAQDWAEMLLRMYLRFAEKEKFKALVVDESRGSEAGIKSAVLEISGAYAYGYLKSEAGVHRLVRLSPYNPAHTRETSFALVEVLPAIEQEEYKLNLSDIEIEAKTSRGHGGQSVNTTYSAIRATHIPTGITVTIQNERSQAQNKQQALKIISSKLAALEEEKQRQEKLALRGEFQSAEWGNQIRSYVLHPYKLVKDHRTGFETSDAESILDGELEEFIKSYLEHTKQK
ncbi:MAG: peptide chain release factor 2 [Candidatus Doudnabacteria bacterium RIFCSPLOWO2_02_FULL_48_8]|uniref:Peptide chain release factor 2 n=1 Tax=Candidatus Doudnabacteria bacterium RIFCSPHIGHO2_01_FULL_46_24 TaxID=1817825 RepID=A0A1F5NTW5_9BACT|nr:MAG: peptide chain release factor 2 [Candidatus Doudnabacteria bacterium RIFCSPHIGHO2_01_FULL_46_24]OGE95480.1 MAG: peptide chain release factor 2 [Candidatus Doudnabacteria bacterium RIFCSPHIGHO2_12_FULL_48_11]OGE95568.1 MAG: peptide chain release factor 2 [Candidatus Doudnabacteria bacterium RIFCSPLOWO2_02_FULL_48_8]